MKINQQKLNKLRMVAKRTLAILNGLEKGQSISEIARDINCDRQLVEYYFKQLTK